MAATKRAAAAKKSGTGRWRPTQGTGANAARTTSVSSVAAQRRLALERNSVPAAATAAGNSGKPGQNVLRHVMVASVGEPEGEWRRRQAVGNQLLDSHGRQSIVPWRTRACPMSTVSLRNGRNGVAAPKAVTVSRHGPVAFRCRVEDTVSGAEGPLRKGLPARPARVRRQLIVSLASGLHGVLVRQVAAMPKHGGRGFLNRRPTEGAELARGA